MNGSEAPVPDARFVLNKTAREFADADSWCVNGKGSSSGIAPCCERCCSLSNINNIRSTKETSNFARALGLCMSCI